MKQRTKTKRAGALFQTRDGVRDDSDLHREMLPAGSLASDEAAIQIMIGNGMSRTDARRLISLGRGYGG